MSIKNWNLKKKNWNLYRKDQIDILEPIHATSKTKSSQNEMFPCRLVNRHWPKPPESLPSPSRATRPFLALGLPVIYQLKRVTCWSSQGRPPPALPPLPVALLPGWCLCFPVCQPFGCHPLALSLEVPTRTK